MATFDDTGRSCGWPTRSLDPRQLVSAAAAETQELALTHAREAFRLTQELLGRADVAGTHRAQLEEGLEYLRSAVEYLGPVEEFVVEVPL